MDPNNSIAQYDNLVLFDGVCIFCNTSVDFILENEQNNELKFTPLQSELGTRILNDFGYPANYLDSILYLNKGELYTRSTAALKISRFLKSPYSWLGVLIIIPAFIRNFFYSIIVKNRYKWFGKYDACTIPAPEVRIRFLE